MELKLIQVEAAKQSLYKVMNFDLPARVAFRLGRFAKAAKDVLQDIEAQRVKLVKKYADESNSNKDGHLAVAPEHVEVFHKEFTELLEQESVTLDIEPLTLDMFKDCALTALDAMNLAPFLADEG